MNVRDALSQIADIRQQVARAQSFRGYRPATTAFSAVVAIATAGLQAILLPEPHAKVTATQTLSSRYETFAPGAFRIDHYLYLWFVAAMVSLVVVGVEMWVRVRRSDSDLQRDLTAAAVEQFIPALVAGLLLTIVIVQFAFESVWMLPGLWMILFAMGVFASRRVLPRFAGVIAGFYLMAGLIVLAMQKEAGLHAWTMGAVFGIGQTAAAGMLWMTERKAVRDSMDPD
jgi:hypothetical protein